MRRLGINIVCILLGIIALAGEVALLCYTRGGYESQRRQEYAGEIKDAVVKISASIRMGEQDHFTEALVKYKESAEKIQPYLKEDEKEKLDNYYAALEADETKELLQLNTTLLALKASQKDPKDIDVSDDETGKEIEKVNEAFKKLKNCEVYCSSKDYREIESALKTGSENLNKTIEALEKENAARLGSEELIEWLDMLK